MKLQSLSLTRSSTKSEITSASRTARLRTLGVERGDFGYYRLKKQISKGLRPSTCQEDLGKRVTRKGDGNLDHIHGGTIRLKALGAKEPNVEKFTTKA